MVSATKRIGYHRISDNSVISFTVFTSVAGTVIGGLENSTDIDRIWYYNDKGMLLYIQLRRSNGS